MAEYDVVLSYAAEDAGWVDKLAESLSSEGVRVLHDPPETTPSRHLQRWLSGDLSQDYKLIAVCSPHYFRDAQVRTLLEGFSRQYSGQLKIQRPLIPVLPPGAPALPIPTALPQIDFNNEEDFELRLRQLLEALDIGHTPQESGIKQQLRALFRWVRVEKTGQQFKDLIAELYRLFGFEVRLDEQIRDLTIDLWVEKRSGGIRYQTMIECAESLLTTRQLDAVTDKYKSVRNQIPGVTCLLVTAQEISLDAIAQLERNGIRVTSYSELLRSLVPLDQYAHTLIADVDNWRAERWQGEDWFIRPDVKTDWVRNSHHAWHQISAWLGGKRGNLLAMLGDLGTGKSTLASFLAYEMAKAYLADPLRHPAPVLVKLLNVRKEVSLESIIISHFSEQLDKAEMDDFSFSRFEYLVRRGRIVLLFDAFDEMAERVRPLVMRNNLKELIRLSEQGGKVLLTCRTHYFRNREEQEKLFGTGAVYLQEFSMSQVGSYLANARPQTKDEDLRKIREIYNLKDLARRPLLLDMIVKAMPTVRSVNAAAMYAEYAKLWFDREQEKGRLLDKQVKISLMRELAWQIWHEEKRAIYFQDLLRLVKELKGRKTLDFGDEAEDDIAEEMRTASFLKRDDDGNYSFADTSFEEYFLACKVYECLKRPAGPPSIRTLLRTRLFSRKVIFFLEKLISEDGVTYAAFQQILQGDYETQVSENALQILYWSERIRCGMEQEITDHEKLRQTLGKCIPKGVQLANARLKEIVLEGADLSEADFTGADLAQANLNHTQLSKASFRGAILASASLENVTAPQADFREAQLSRAVFKHADLTNADFTGVISRETIFEDNNLDGAKGLNAAGSLRKSGLQPVVQQLLSPGLHTLAFDSSGEFCASSGHDGLLVIFRVKDERLLHVLEGHRRRALCLQFSPSGTLLVSGGKEGGVRLWSVGEGRMLHEHNEHTGRVNAVTFSPDGKLVASGGDDKIVRLWSVDQNQVRYLEGFQGHQSNISALSFSFDGQKLASGSENGGIRVWDVNTGYLIQVLRTEDQSTAVINTLQFSPDGRMLAGGSADNLVRLWSVSQGKLLRVLDGHEGELASLHFSPDGQLLASGGKDRTVRLWSAGGRVSYSITQQSLTTLATAKIPKHILDRLAQVREQEIVGEEPFLRLLAAKVGPALSPELIPQILKAAEVGPLLHSVVAHEDWVCAVRFLPDGKHLVSGGGDRHGRLWQLRNHTLEAVESTHINKQLKQRVGIRSVRVAPNGQMIAFGKEDNLVYLWRANSSRPHRTLEGHTDLIRAVDLSTDGQLAASGSDDGTVRIWSAEDGSLLHTGEGHKGRVTSLHFSPKDPVLASGSEDRCVGLWLVNTGQLSNTLRGHQGAVNAVQFSPDGSLLASASEDKTVWLWSAVKGQIPKVQKKLEGHVAGIQAVEFSPNGVWLATAGKEGLVRLWLAISGRPRHVLDGHTDVVTTLRFFPDSSRIATGGEDGGIQIWNVTSGELVRSLPGHLGKVYSIDLSRNGKYLIAGGAAGRAQIWNTETGQTVLYRYAFSPEAWLDLLPDGRFNASAEGRRHLCYTEMGELNSHSAEILMTDFHDPEGVHALLEQFSQLIGQ
ncbi:MAG TPA: pentapeptide repeat-containing protein [Blastocatellia bacterium]|nr:pentapeptide repeat-containing protein [Blastocatellia bacterium]HMX26686.1 pentapeptide repeat-containing protein [Blastocatellia bacterium]HMZ17784.1 pentapeptide repeat-containing protein [Blastocatellia bacterium]HNG30802.1 pentapeptide repeat-containing protein [Blastocatellia bacterium]